MNKLIVGIIGVLALGANGCTGVKAAKYSESICPLVCQDIGQLTSDKCADICTESIPSDMLGYDPFCKSACVIAVDLGETKCVDVCLMGVQASFDALDASYHEPRD